MKKSRIVYALLLCLLVCGMIFALSACTGGEDLPKIEGVTFEGGEFIYDENNVVERKIEVSGLPEGATVTYEPKNVFSAPGNYTVTARITMEGYKPLTLTATLKIVRPSAGGGDDDGLLTVKFDTLCSTTIADVKVEPGATVSRPSATLYRTGYTFSDWYYNGERWNFSTPITEDITITAKWDIAKYNIVYHIDGGATLPSDAKKSYTIEDDAYTLPIPTVDPGVEFKGWFDASGENQITSIAKGSYGTVDLWAKIDFVRYPITYTLTATGAINNSMNPAEASAMNAGATLYAPSAVGYTFLGWYTTEGYTEGTEITKLPDTVTEAISIYAKWEMNRYPINYVLNGGTNSTSNPDSFTYFDSITLNDARKSGEKFLGWFNGSVKVTSISGVKTPMTLEARWEPYDYIINYSLGGGTNNEENPLGLNTEDAVITLLPAYLEGYSFDGWYDDMLSGNRVTSIDPATVTEDITLYARFTSGTPGIVFSYSGGKYTVADYIGTDTEVKIPSTYNGRSVVAIGANAFEGTAVTSVKIPLSVTEIGQYAFKNCTALSSIKLVKSVTTVGQYAFFGCTALEAITCMATSKPAGFDAKFNYRTETVAITVNYTDSSLLLPPVPLG